MNKINDLGMELLQYKKEMQQDYSPIVIEALGLALNEMIENGIIDQGVVELIKNEDIEMKHFEDFLLNSEKYSKTPEEIRKEMEEMFTDFKNKFDLNSLNKVVFKVDIESESFIMMKTLGFKEDFILNYFGVMKSDLPKLMEKKGFVEKFAALRLKKVADNIVLKLGKKYNINLSSSLAYINEKETGYNIDIIYKIKIDDITNNSEKTKELISDISYESEKIYDEMMKC